MSGICMLNSDFLFTFESQNLPFKIDFFYKYIRKCDEMTAFDSFSFSTDNPR